MKEKVRVSPKAGARLVFRVQKYCFLSSVQYLKLMILLRHIDNLTILKLIGDANLLALVLIL